MWTRKCSESCIGMESRQWARSLVRYIARVLIQVVLARDKKPSSIVRENWWLYLVASRFYYPCGCAYCARVIRACIQAFCKRKTTRYKVRNTHLCAARVTRGAPHKRGTRATMWPAAGQSAVWLCRAAKLISSPCARGSCGNDWLQVEREYSGAV